MPLMGSVNAIRFPYFDLPLIFLSLRSRILGREEGDPVMAPRSSLSLAQLGHAAPAMAPRPGLRAIWRAIQTRRQLAEMDDRMLRDIGISRLDALQEAERAPWDLAPRP